MGRGGYMGHQGGLPTLPGVREIFSLSWSLSDIQVYIYHSIMIAPMTQ